jgi:hypothetical protein
LHKESNRLAKALGVYAADRHATAEHEPRHDQKPAADAEKARNRADHEPDRDQADGDPWRHANVRIALGGAWTQHRRSDRDHGECEEEQQLLTIDQLSKRRANRSAEYAGNSRFRDYFGTRPFTAFG